MTNVFSRCCAALAFAVCIYSGGLFAALTLEPGCGASQSVAVGTLKATYDYEGDRSGFPTMVTQFDYAVPASEAVPEGCELRWFQVVTRYDPIQPEYLDKGVKSATWRGEDVASYGLPFTDPPRGGYDYQQPAGDDNEPFYWNTATEWPQANKPGNYSLIVDTPKRFAPGVTGFETCLVLYCPLQDPKTLYLLEDGCFTWELRLSKQSNLLAIGARSPRPVQNANTPGHAAYLQQALDNAGFADWKIEAVPPCDVGGSAAQISSGALPMTALMGGVSGLQIPAAGGFPAPAGSFPAIPTPAAGGFQAPAVDSPGLPAPAAGGFQGQFGALAQRIAQMPAFGAGLPGAAR